MTIDYTSVLIFFTDDTFADAKLQKYKSKCKKTTTTSASIPTVHIRWEKIESFHSFLIFYVPILTQLKPSTKWTGKCPCRTSAMPKAKKRRGPRARNWSRRRWTYHRVLIRRTRSSYKSAVILFYRIRHSTLEYRPHRPRCCVGVKNNDCRHRDAIDLIVDGFQRRSEASIPWQNIFPGV